MRCLKDEEIIALLMNEPTEDERESPEGHLTLCKRCRMRLESFKGVLEICSSLERMKTSEDFESRVWMELYRDLEHKTRLGRMFVAARISKTPSKRKTMRIYPSFPFGVTRTGRGEIKRGG